MPRIRKIFRDFRNELHELDVGSRAAAPADMIRIYDRYRAQAKPADLEELYATFLGVREELLILSKASALDFWLLFVERFGQPFYSADDKVYLFCSLRFLDVGEISRFPNYAFVLSEIEHLHESTRGSLSAKTFAEQSAALKKMQPDSK